jgi:uncharacterized lipoprotein YbaY
MTISGTIRISDRDQAGELRGVVRLEDVTVVDTQSRVLATTPIVMAAATSKVPFQLSIDRMPDPKGSYIITARLEGQDIRTGRTRIFGTTAAHPWRPGYDAVEVTARVWN